MRDHEMNCAVCQADMPFVAPPAPSTSPPPIDPTEDPTIGTETPSPGQTEEPFAGDVVVVIGTAEGTAAVATILAEG